MILQALYRHYETLVEKGELSRPGWTDAFKVSFALELDEFGTLQNVIDLRTAETRGKKTVIVPRPMRVPAHAPRSSDISANFLCDNSSYMLGADEKGKPERAISCFEACAELHRKLLADVNTPAAKAVLGFFESWDPGAANQHPLLAPRWKELTGNANLIFFYQTRAITEDAAICEAWQRHYDSDAEDVQTGQCLITGEEAPIAATHPLIKGVLGAQSSGAALVSFNAPAFCSYGHTQNLNAPVSTRAAFAYTAALNYLLADRSHCKTIGDTTVVCWAEHGDNAYQDVTQALLFGPPQEGITELELAEFLEALSCGKPLNWQGKQLDPDEHFYVLGLSPNAARLSVRFFLRDTFGGFAENINRHYKDIEIVRPGFDQTRHLPVWRLAAETVNQKSRNKQAAPQLSGDLLRAVLMGTQYPATLLSGVQLRIRAEHEVTRGRAAIIKGYYSRANIPCEKEVFTVELNEESRYQPYVLGRLFSVLEAVQEAANPGVNTTIKDKYFNSASATPASIFPLLINLSQKHLRKLSMANRTYFDKQLTGLLGMISADYPSRMTLPEQGAFQIGYYHQTQRRYMKKEEKENA